MSKKPFIILSILAGLTLAGCGEKGPAEQAGETIDEAVEQTKDAVEEAGQNASEAIDEMKDEANKE